MSQSPWEEIAELRQRVDEIAARQDETRAMIFEIAAALGLITLTTTEKRRQRWGLSSGSAQR